MRRLTVVINVILGAALLLAGCSLPFSEVGDSSAVERIGAQLPDDEVRDVVRTLSGPFTFETIYPVDVELIVELYETDEQGVIQGEPLPPESADVYVTLEDSDGNTVYSGLVADDGTLNGTVQLPSAPEDMTLTLSAPGFEPRTVVIDDMVEFETIARTMALSRVVAADGTYDARSVGDTTDSDGDGVVDEYDAYPDDPERAFKMAVPGEGEPVTIAYEDLFGRENAGDADYNDFIATYTIEEGLASDGAVKTITVNAEARTKLAGYNHRFGIRFDAFSGEAELHFRSDSGDWVLADDAITAPAEIDVFLSTKHEVGTSKEFMLTFDTAQDRDGALAGERLPDAPYNPYLFVYNTGHDIHLIGREPNIGSRNPDDEFVDGKNFPWALLVPTDWTHPGEAVRIDNENVYPRFTLWRESGGTEHTDWYEHYNDPYEPPTTSQNSVYVAGFYNDGTNDVAAYWEAPTDGSAPVRTDLTDGVPTGADAYAQDVFVVGTDVYVAGYYGESDPDVGTVYRALYWVNGVATALSTADESVQATGIHVDASVVYVSGEVIDQTDARFGVPIYWRDGVRTDLLGSFARNGTAGNVAVDGGEALVVGHFDNSTTAYTATLWRSAADITAVDLSAGENTEACDIDVGSDGNYYVAGSFFNGSSFASQFWVVDSATGTTSSTVLTSVEARSNFSKAFGIDEVAGTVYTAGYFTENSTDAPAYWVGTSRTNLPGGSSGRAKDVVVVNGTPYVVGYYIGADASEAVLWTEGTALELSASIGGDAEATAVHFPVQ
jgi:LruC domain-containing protein